MNVIEK